MDELKESVSVKITCLEHMSQVLSESKRLNIEHREEAARCKQERDAAFSQLNML
jgi:Ethanolamine utilization protein EutJ (predicted chaperonin)